MTGERLVVFAVGYAVFGVLLIAILVAAVRQRRRMRSSDDETKRALVEIAAVAGRRHEAMRGRKSTLITHTFPELAAASKRAS